jgi:hypothetical protein
MLKKDVVSYNMYVRLRSSMQRGSQFVSGSVWEEERNRVQI